MNFQYKDYPFPTNCTNQVNITDLFWKHDRCKVKYFINLKFNDLVRNSEYRIEIKFNPNKFDIRFE